MWTIGVAWSWDDDSENQTPLREHSALRLSKWPKAKPVSRARNVWMIMISEFSAVS